MARSEARIKTAIWRDRDFAALDINEQWAYFVILSQPTLNLCGVTSYNAGRWSALAADATPQRLRKAVAVLARSTIDKPKIVVDETTEEVWVRTFVRHDGVLTKPNVIVSMSRDFASIQSATIRKGFLEGLGEGFPELLAERFPDRFREGLWKRLAEPFREAFDERFRESPARTPAQSLQPPASSLQPPPTGYSSSTNSSHVGNGAVENRLGKPARCVACQGVGWVQGASEKDPCPGNCPASKRFCYACRETKIVYSEAELCAIPCPACSPVPA